MKHILTPMVLMILLFPGLSLGETMDDLVNRDGLYYKNFTDVPFTGNITGKIQGTFKDGKKQDGPWVYYYDNGQLWKKGTIKDGKREGPWVYNHENGQLSYKGTYEDGKKQDGPWVSYHDNGQLWGKGTYKDGKKHGPWVWYYWENGQLFSKGTHKEGKKEGIWFWYDDNGNIKREETYKDGKLVEQ